MQRQIRCICSMFHEPLASIKENLSATETHNDALHLNMVHAAQVHKNIKNTEVLFGAVVMTKQVHRAVCFHARLRLTIS